MLFFKESPTKILKETLKIMYSVNDVETGYNYWFNKLLARCMSIFDWTNLPDSLPEREIELNILLTGHCVIFKKNDEIVTQCTTLYGNENSIYYYPTKAIYANPKIGYGMLDISKDCEIVYNTPLQNNIFYMNSDGGMLTFIQRYARQLADIESSINIYTVNTRAVSYPTACNDNVRASIEKFMDKIAIGKRAVISDNAIIEQFRNVDITRGTFRDGINDLLIARDKILEQFYRDIGVKFYNPKKAQVTEDEVESNDQLLLISLKDMLKERKSGLERVNARYGTNIGVDISDEFKTRLNASQGGKNNVQSKRDM